MTRKILSLACICIAIVMFVGCALPSSLPLQTSSNPLFSDYDFRTFNWGDPDYLVRKEEGALLTYEGDNRIIYWTTFLGYTCDVTYCFNENKLNHGYVRIDSNDDKEKVYKAVASELKTLYGEPCDKTKSSMKFTCEDNSTVYLSKDGLQVAVLFSDKSSSSN